MLDTYLLQVWDRDEAGPWTDRDLHRNIHKDILVILYLHLYIYIYPQSTYAIFVCMKIYSRTETVYGQHSSKNVSETKHVKSIYSTCWPSSTPHLRGLARYMDVPCNTKVDILVTWRFDGTEGMTSCSMKQTYPDVGGYWPISVLGNLWITAVFVELLIMCSRFKGFMPAWSERQDVNKF